MHIYFFRHVSFLERFIIDEVRHSKYWYLRNYFSRTADDAVWQIKGGTMRAVRNQKPKEISANTQITKQNR